MCILDWLLHVRKSQNGGNVAKHWWEKFAQMIQRLAAIPIRNSRPKLFVSLRLARAERLNGPKPFVHRCLEAVWDTGAICCVIASPPKQWLLVVKSQSHCYKGFFQKPKVSPCHQGSLVILFVKLLWLVTRRSFWGVASTSCTLAWRIHWTSWWESETRIF